MPEKKPLYHLGNQVGFVLRQASQRHLAIFSRTIDGLTPMQFAAMAKLHEAGALSQNALGRLTAMDAATIKGVVDRIGKRGLVSTERDTQDRRRTIVSLTEEGVRLIKKSELLACSISEETLAPLSKDDQVVFLQLLKKLT